MNALNRSRAGRRMAAIATAGITGIAAMGTTPTTPTITAFPPRSQDVVLAAAAVPLGGLLTTFVGNQGIYCSIICPLLADTGTTAAMATFQAPGVFINALQSGEALKAIGAAVASVTGPTNDAAAAAILADGTLVAPRALNAFEVGVVGLLNVLSAIPVGLPGVIDAIHAARQQTFDALNAPIVPNPTQLAIPHGIVQVTVISAINVVAAVIFPAFNDVLGAVFSAPNAAAQELAATGDPARAIAAGMNSAATSLDAAVTVISKSVTKAVHDIRAAAGHSSAASTVALHSNPTAGISDAKTRTKSPATATAPDTASPSKTRHAGHSPARHSRETR